MEGENSTKEFIGNNAYQRSYRRDEDLSGRSQGLGVDDRVVPASEVGDLEAVEAEERSPVVDQVVGHAEAAKRRKAFLFFQFWIELKI